MGSNSRYGSDLTEGALNDALTRPQPISLSAAELGTDAVKEARESVAVDAWVRFPESPIQVRARAIAWTRRAVRIEWESRDGAVRRAWVWASAVKRVGS